MGSKSSPKTVEETKRPVLKKLLRRSKKAEQNTTGQVNRLWSGKATGHMKDGRGFLKFSEKGF